MNHLPEIELSLTEFKEIITTIKEHRGVDLTMYVISILKRRIESFYSLRYSYLSLKKFIQNLLKDNKIFNNFINYILLPTTELFRDPVFWKILKIRIIPAIIRENMNFKIWMPEITTDDELFSLLILLYELDLLDKITVVATSPYKCVLDKFKEPVYITEKKFTNSNDNYLVYNENSTLNRYFQKKLDYYLLKDFLLKNVDFQLFSFINDNRFGEFNMVIFRNRMLYFNMELYNLALDKISRSIPKDGYIILGYNETLNKWHGESAYFLVEKTENIYRKK